MSPSASDLLVSIVIPVYNGADFLAQAIDSALAQTWPHIEVIVVDDGSDDEGRTAQIAARYGDRIRYHHKANGGVATAVNTGIHLMRGRYLSWLSHDDVYVADKIERQVQALLALGRPAMAFSDFASMDRDGGNRVEYRCGDGHDPGQPLMTLLHYGINGCATLVHRDCLADGNWFDPGLPSTQDYDLWFRIVCRYPLIYVPGVVVHQRLHAQQGSRVQRFRDEVILLWLSVLDRLPPSQSDSDAPGHALDLLRLQGSPAIQSAPVLRQAAERLVAPYLRDCTVAVALPDEPSLSRIEELADALHRLGIQRTGLWAIRAPGSALQLIRLEWPHGRSVSVNLVAGGGADVTWRLLAGVVASSDAEYVWLMDGASRASGFPSGELLCLLQHPAAVACVRSGEGLGGVLAGAVFRAAALRQALADAPEGLAALVHALARQGEFVSVAQSAALQEAPQDITTAPPPMATLGAQDVAPLPLAMRLSFALLRRPAWAGAVWRLLRMALGRQAGQRLLRWTGLQGTFETDWYLRAYPEVAAADIDPVFHYLMFGQKEGRDPSPVFHTRAYLSQHPQVAQQGFNALQHYVAWGRRHGYAVQPSAIGAEPPELPDARGALMLVLDGQTEDAVRFAQDLRLQLHPRLRVLCLSARSDGAEWVFGSDAQGRWGRRLDPVQHRALLASLVACHAVGRALVLGEPGAGTHLAGLMAAINRPVDLVLMAADRQGDAASRLTTRLSEPDRRRLRASAQTLFATSEALAQQLRAQVPAQVVTVAAPPDPYRLRGFRPWAQPVLAGAPLRIALFGTVGDAEGRRMLIEVLQLVRAQRLPLQFMLFGQARPALPQVCAKDVPTWTTCIGSELVNAVGASRPHLAWFPLEAPAGCSYALTDAESVGLPVAAVALGEMTERLQQRPLSWLLPAATPCAGWLQFFLQLQRVGMPDTQAVRDPFSQRFHDADTYRRHFLARL